MRENTKRFVVKLIHIVSVSGSLPLDPLLDDNKALLAPLIAQLQAVPSSTITADFT